MKVRLNRLAAVLAAYGVTLTEDPQAKHRWKFRRAGSRPYPIPVKRENDEVPTEYWKGVCRAFGIEKKLVEEALFPPKAKGKKK